MSEGAKDYRRLSVSEKEAHNRMHEPPTRCPECDVAVQPDDLLAHLDGRCQGRPDPHPRSRWVSWSEAVAMGMTKSRLGQLAASGAIRTKDRNGQKSYMLLDVVHLIARGKRTPQKRSRPIGRADAPKQPSARPLAADTVTRLEALVVAAGSVEAAARAMRVPVRTVRRGVLGKQMRTGTRLAIRNGLEKALGRK